MRNTVAARKSAWFTVSVLLRGCRKFEFKWTVIGFSLSSYLRIAVTVRSVIANCRFGQITLMFLLHLHEIAILKRIFIVLKKIDDCGS